MLQSERVSTLVPIHNTRFGVTFFLTGCSLDSNLKRPFDGTFNPLHFWFTNLQMTTSDALGEFFHYLSVHQLYGCFQLGLVDLVFDIVAVIPLFP